MTERMYFIVVLGALTAGIGLGIAIGVSEPTKHNIEWETLAAGLFGLIGGGFAFFGAVAPMNKVRQQMREKFRHDVYEACRELLEEFDVRSSPMGDETRARIEQENGRQLTPQEIAEYREYVDDALLRVMLANVQNNSAESLICRAAANTRIPEVPDAILNHKILAERMQLIRNIRQLATGRCDLQFPLRVRDQIKAFLEEITDL